MLRAQNNSNHGEGKRMADGVNSYLLFFSAGSHFLLPLSCVKRVTDMKEREPEMALADFLELPEAGNLSDQAYLIIADCGDREIGIRAEVCLLYTSNFGNPDLPAIIRQWIGWQTDQAISCLLYTSRCV